MKERCVTLVNTTGNKLGESFVEEASGQSPTVAGIATSPHNRGTIDEFLGFVGV